MSLRPNELQQVIEEIDRELRGAFVQKAHAPAPRLCHLELRLPGKSVRLCASAEPGFARVSVGGERPPSPPEAPPFQHRLRQELLGARLLGADAPGGGAARLSFETKRGPRALVVELRGADANLLLLAGDRVLAASAPGGERTRPGSEWSAPETKPERADLPSRLVPAPGAALPYAEAAEALVGAKAGHQRAQEVRRRLSAPARARLAQIDRTIGKVQAEAARAPDAERHRELGELLAQNLHRVSRGDRSVRLTRYTEEGAEEIEVPLDPSRAPKDEVERHFHQYRRLLRGCEHAKRRLTELEEERRTVQGRIAEIESLGDDELLASAPAEAAPRRAPERAKPYKEFRAADGRRILVGKNAAGNDALTFRIARPHDVWLHARGVGGSHVIAEAERGGELPPEALLDAAHLAHHHSQNKDEPRGEVAWTHARFVRRMKGGAPGQVTYTRERTLILRFEPSRLERLLKTRV